MLEADFARFYRIDLAEAVFGREKLTIRRLGVLMRGLPLESRVARDLGAPKPGDWTNDTELLAGLTELVHAQIRLFILANSDPKRPTPRVPVLRIPRPGDLGDQNRKRAATPEELANWLGKSGGIVRYHPSESN